MVHILPDAEIFRDTSRGQQGLTPNRFFNHPISLTIRQFLL